MSVPPGVVTWGGTGVAEAATTLLTDNAPQDATTDVRIAVTAAKGGVCEVTTATAVVWGQGDFGQKATPDTFSFTISYLQAWPGGVAPFCPDTIIPPEEIITVELEFLDCSTGVWNTVALPAPTASMSLSGYFDYIGTFPAGCDARIFRATLTHTSSHLFGRPDGTVVATAILSDFRLTGTLIPIAPPTGLAGSGVCEGAQATLTWDSVSNAARYNVYRDGVVYASGVTATMKLVTGLTIGIAYSFTVSAVDACGFESAQSDPVVITPCATTSGWGTDALPPPLSPDEWTDDCLWSTQTGWTDDTGLPF